jgi:elongation factor G
LTDGYASLREIHSALYEGINAALSRGPKLGYPVSQIRVRCVGIGLYSSSLSTASAIRAGAHSCVKKLLSESPNISILEPIMNMQINLPNQYVGAVSRDLSGQRRGLILSIDSLPGTEGDGSSIRTLIVAETPLAHLIGYASILRGLTHGNGECKMDLCGYAQVSVDQELKVLKLIRGF